MSMWMSNLPQGKTAASLTNLCIPGSHDSFSYDLNENLPIAVDQPEILQKMCCSAVKNIVKRWSQTQHLTCSQQLELGIRYFDTRLGKGPDGKYVVLHGLYAEPFENYVRVILEFLNRNAKEVVLIDFNHFYNMSAADHVAVMDSLCLMLASKLAPAELYLENPALLSLSELWTRNQQVLVFYQTTDVSVCKKLFDSRTIASPWANSNSEVAVLDYMESAVRQRGSTSEVNFLSLQGIITPKLSDVLGNCCGSLETRYAIKMTNAVVQWLTTRVGPELRKNMNIVIVDFVELDNFCDAVIRLNLQQ